MHRILVVSPNRTTRAQIRDRVASPEIEVETSSELPLAPQGWKAIITDLDPGADEAFELSRSAVIVLIDPGATTRRLCA
ncbi:MAG: hypothetical protein KDA28_17580, partial [Phycisphaerales bacterium]|nr:hypothetical protein [Phycisphaerales bacterium]